MSGAGGRDFSGESESTTLSEGISRALNHTTLTEATTTAVPEEV